MWTNKFGLTRLDLKGVSCYDILEKIESDVLKLITFKDLRGMLVNGREAFFLN